MKCLVHSHKDTGIDVAGPSPPLSDSPKDDPELGKAAQLLSGVLLLWLSALWFAQQHSN